MCGLGLSVLTGRFLSGKGVTVLLEIKNNDRITA